MLSREVDECKPLGGGKVGGKGGATIIIEDEEGNK
jgi:hypothetical protein